MGKNIIKETGKNIIQQEKHATYLHENILKQSPGFVSDTTSWVNQNSVGSLLLSQNLRVQAETLKALR